MIKTLRNLFKQDKEKFVVPKSVQAVIPIKTIWEDGIFLVGKNKYAKTFKFEDINYAVASREDKEAMFLEYSELLNALDSGATTKITINNRRLNKADFEQTILIPMAEDGLDKYRTEYNKMLLDKATGANSIVQDKYVTISVCKKNIEEARHYFARVGADLIGHFSRLGSKCTELDAEEKLRIFHDFYRTGEETAFGFSLRACIPHKNFISVSSVRRARALLSRAAVTSLRRFALSLRRRTAPRTGLRPRAGWLRLRAGCAHAPRGLKARTPHGRRGSRAAGFRLRRCGAFCPFCAFRGFRSRLSFRLWVLAQRRSAGLETHRRTASDA